MRSKIEICVFAEVRNSSVSGNGETLSLDLWESLCNGSDEAQFINEMNINRANHLVNLM